MVKKEKTAVILAVLVTSSVLVPLVAFAILRVRWHTCCPFLAVSGDSMYPAFRQGDLVLLKGRGPGEIDPGEVVAFSTEGVWPEPDRNPVVHRVTNKFQVNGAWYYVTKGDNNPVPDVYPIPHEKVLGVVFSHYSKVGFVALLLNGYGLTWILIGVVVVSIFAVNLVDRLKGEEKTKNLKNGGDEENGG
ncbi:MAG: signal peptidase I [Promethearchaeota archaeon]